MSRGLSDIFTRRTKGRAPTGETVRRLVNGCRGRHVVLTLAISADVELAHHWLQQEVVTRSTFQSLINDIEQHLAELAPCEGHCSIIFDGARPHLNVAWMLKPSTIFLHLFWIHENKLIVPSTTNKNTVAQHEIMEELGDWGKVRGTKSSSRMSRILMRIGEERRSTWSRNRNVRTVPAGCIVNASMLKRHFNSLTV